MDQTKQSVDAITIKNLTFGYTKEPVLENLNLTVGSHEFTAIIGENGSGKSTLLKLLLGQYRAQEGSLEIFGTEIQKKRKFPEVGYVPQVQSFNRIAFPVTCAEMVAMNLYDHFGPVKIPRKKHYKRVAEVLEESGLSEYYKVPFNQLSGGLQQRVMIARAMINMPKLLILDEPTAGVDQESKTQFLQQLHEVHKSLDLALILVTHEIGLVCENVELDSIYRMSNGVLGRLSDEEIARHCDVSRTN